MQRLLLALAFLATATTVTAQSADRAPAYDGAPVLMQPNPSAPSAARGGVLFDQTDLVTSVGTGPAGSDESALQTALTMTTFGAGHSLTAGVFVADDFTVPAGETWTINGFNFYAYQTGGTVVCTMTGYYVQIWDGPPGSTGATVIAGDRTTNLFQGCDFANIYRVRDVDPPGTAVTRPIYQSAAAFTTPLELTEGTYWVDWAATGSLASGPWVPPITIVGQTTTGNARQELSGAWADLQDGGSLTPQGLPFQVLGTSEGGGGGTVTVTSTDTPISIPDGPGVPTTCGVPGAPATSTISVSGVSGNVTDLDVSINITHTWVGDIDATVAKGATSVLVIDNPGAATPTACGSGTDNMAITLDDEGTNPVETGPFPLAGTYTPNSPLSAFDGTAANGDWTLTITDGGLGDTGSLDSWALIITAGGGTATESGPNGLSELRVAPNPMTTQGQAVLRVASAQDVRVVLYDALGREVRVLLDRALSAGQQAHIAFRTDDLPAGVYVLRAVGTDVSLTERVTVVR